MSEEVTSNHDQRSGVTDRRSEVRLDSLGRREADLYSQAAYLARYASNFSQRRTLIEELNLRCRELTLLSPQPTVEERKNRYENFMTVFYKLFSDGVNKTAKDCVKFTVDTLQQQNPGRAVPSPLLQDIRQAIETVSVNIYADAA